MCNRSVFVFLDWRNKYICLIFIFYFVSFDNILLFLSTLKLTMLLFQCFWSLQVCHLRLKYFFFWAQMFIIEHNYKWQCTIIFKCFFLFSCFMCWFDSHCLIEDNFIGTFFFWEVTVCFKLSSERLIPVLYSIYINLELGGWDVVSKLNCTHHNIIYLHRFVTEFWNSLLSSLAAI